MTREVVRITVLYLDADVVRSVFVRAKQK